MCIGFEFTISLLLKATFSFHAILSDISIFNVKFDPATAALELLVRYYALFSFTFQKAFESCLIWTTNNIIHANFMSQAESQVMEIINIKI